MRSVILALVWPMWLVGPASARADIKFEDATAAAQITGRGTTFGASWGDLNGDGWPDLWVGDHDMPPVLYLNQADGTFRNVASEAWSGNPRSDYHGAAWADFDGDGDEDLIVVADAAYENGKLVVTHGDDELLENRDGRLQNVSTTLGITSHQSSRTPLWLDADRDGQLDLLIVARKDVGSRSVFYRHTKDGFQAERLGLNERPSRRREYYYGLLENIMSLRFRFPDDMS